MPEAPLPPLVVTDDEPTPLLRDLTTFMDFVESPECLVSKKTRLLSPDALHAINGTMLTHRAAASPRAFQEAYPLLNLFHRALLASGLYRLAPGPTEQSLRMVPTEAASAFRSLTPPERYVSLLEALWVECDWGELVGGGGYGGALGIICALEVLGQAQASHEFDLDAFRAGRRLPQEVYLALRLLSFFGFASLVVEDASRTERRGSAYGIAVRRFTPTVLGCRMVEVLTDQRPLCRWSTHEDARFMADDLAGEGQDDDQGSEDERPSQAHSGVGRASFHDAFVPLFGADELRRCLPRVERTYQSGTYRFRVGTGARRQAIALADDRTLEDLHCAVRRAFHLGGDHLYAFYLDGQRFSEKAVNDPRGDDPPFADETTIGSLDLFVGQRILYLYDFGDEVTLDVELESVEASPPPRSASSAAGGRKRRRGRTRKA